MNAWWFNSWENILQAMATAAAGFAVLFALGRLYGKRATSRMNNFDWFVTVAIGAIFASTVIRADVAFFEGVGAIVVLLSLQFAITFATSHWNWARKIFIAKPKLLYRDGEFIEDALQSERVSRQEVVSAVRGQGLGSLKEAHAVVLESNSVLSIVKPGDNDDFEAVGDVQGYDDVQDDRDG